MLHRLQDQDSAVFPQDSSGFVQGLYRVLVVKGEGKNDSVGAIVDKRQVLTGPRKKLCLPRNEDVSFNFRRKLGIEGGQSAEQIGQFPCQAPVSATDLEQIAR